jgi:hypothetical protein
LKPEPSCTLALSAFQLIVFSIDFRNNKERTVLLGFSSGRKPISAILFYDSIDSSLNLPAFLGKD